MSIKTNCSRNIIPDIKSGLPLEIWQIILSNLCARDMCHICRVCRGWREFMVCIDSTRWKQLYMSFTEWKHPNWPLKSELDPVSWKHAFREQYLASQFWQSGAKDLQYQSCLSHLKRTSVKKVINVGPGKEHESLRSALSVANNYDQICVYPGVYDEQFEMSSKIPFELIGCGELGSVILIVCIEQVAITGRLRNLVLRAPWFTTFILKVRSGFMQIDNCILEDGVIYAQNPGTCYIRFSSFRHATVILQHMNASIIEHCEFSQSDTADVIVEGHAKEDKNWTYSYLCQLTQNLISPNEKTDIEDLRSNSGKQIDSNNVSVNCSDSPQTANREEHDRNDVCDVGEKMSSVSEWVRKLSYNPQESVLSHKDESENLSLSEASHVSFSDLDANSISEPESRQSHHSTSSSSSTDDSLSMIRSGSEDDLSDGSVVMLPHLRQRYVRLSTAKNASKSDDVSLAVNFKHLRFSFTKDSTANELLNRVKGCLIHSCRMTHSKGGVMVSLQGQAIVSACDISDVSYGIRCIQNAQVVIIQNKIHHCRTSGIFMRMASVGLIAGNDIFCNLEAGIDIRKHADPVIQYNRIHHGKRSGIVVLGSGRGKIEKNDIFENKEAGIYILYGGNPTIRCNYICDGQAAGIAVNEGGRGIITDNKIEGNKWGGIDIRHDAGPIIADNTIINGSGDGIVIGEKGIGCVENNIISGNAGCGVWIMNASKSYIHGNQISANGDCGIMLVDKSDVLHDGTAWTFYGGTERHITHKDKEILSTNHIDCTMIQYNNIFNNQGKGMSVQHCDKLIIRFNTILTNQSDGVLIDQESKVEVISNSINNNQGSGIITSISGLVDIVGNGVFDNKDGGIVCYNEATINQNDVVANDNHAIILHGCFSVNVCENRIQSENVPAIKIHQVKNGVVENNIIYDEKTFYQTQVQTDIIQETKHEEQSNSDEQKASFQKAIFLMNPAARPHVDPAPERSHIPSHSTTITGGTVTSDLCPQGSKVCSIL